MTIEELDPVPFACGLMVLGGATATVKGEVKIEANNATGVVCSGGVVTLKGDLSVYGGAAAMGVVMEDLKDSTYAKVYLNGIVDVRNSEGKVVPYISWGDDDSPLGVGVVEEGYLLYTSPDGYGKVYIKVACMIDETIYPTLDEALAATAPDAATTIKLLRNIDYDKGIEVYDKTITFNLNGHTLNVTSDDGDGLYVGGNSDTGEHGVVNIEGEGEFNVESSLGYGVQAVNGGQATVTNVTSSYDTGVAAEGVGNNRVEVMGNVTGANGIGAHSGSEVIVHGNVTATDANGYGVCASDGGLAVIKGVLTVPSGGVYIMLDIYGGEDIVSTTFTAGQGAAGTGIYADYLLYTDGTNRVYVKALVNATLDPATATFDKNLSKQADVTAAVTWNGASSITDVKAGATSIGAPNYSVSGNTLTIKKAYLATKAVGSLVLTVVFDKGASATLTVTVSNSASGGAAPSGDDGPAYGARTLSDAATGVTVSGGGIHGQARLAVTPVDTQSLPDALKQAVAKGALLLGFEVTLSGGFQGSLTISFPVGAQYNGQTVTVLHYVNGKAEAHTAVVADGKATITVTSLSPFAVVLPAQAVKVPNTGGAAAAYGFALILLAALSAGYAVRKKHRA